MLKSIVIIIILFCDLAFSQTFREIKRFGGLGNGPAQFSKPTAVVAGTDAKLYVVDSGNNRIQVFDFSGNLIKSIGGFGFGNDQFNLPKDIWTKSIINIYVSDNNNQRLLRYDRYLHYISAFNSSDSWHTEYQFQEVLSCAINSQKDLFILDRGENKIIKFNRLREPERSFGAYEAGDVLEEPVQIDIVQGNKLIISDIARKSVLIYDFFGSFIMEIAGKEFKRPSGLASFNQNELLVADPGARKIFLISSNFKKITSLNMELSEPLNYPRDITVFTETKKNKKLHHAFIVDNNDVIIGRITD